MYSKMTKFNQHKPDDEYIVVELYKDFEKEVVMSKILFIN
jgi:hypothetical protein